MQNFMIKIIICVLCIYSVISVAVSILKPNVMDEMGEWKIYGIVRMPEINYRVEGEQEWMSALETGGALGVDYMKEIQKTEPDMTGEKFTQITQCLDEQVPEIFDEWAGYVAEKSEGKAHMMERMGGDYVPEDVYRDYGKTEYLGKYYCVYVGESWDDHCVNWAYFYVREDFDEVLWYDHVSIMDSEYCVLYLDEWRDSEWYPDLEK